VAVQGKRIDILSLGQMRQENAIMREGLVEKRGRVGLEGGEEGILQEKKRRGGRAPFTYCRGPLPFLEKEGHKKRSRRRWGGLLMKGGKRMVFRIRESLAISLLSKKTIFLGQSGRR